MQPFLRGLRSRLILLILLTVLPFIGLTLYFNVQQRQHIRLDAQKNALHLVNIVVAEQEQLRREAKELLMILAQLPVMQNGNTANCEKLLNELLAEHPFSTAIAVATPEGEVICSAPPLDEPVSFADRPWFHEVLQTQDFVSSDYILGRVSHKSTIVLAHPILDPSKNPQAVIAIGLDLSWVNQIFANAALPADSAYTMIDTNGTILARHPDPEDWVEKNVSDTPLINEILSTETEGVLEAEGLDGVERLYAFAPIENDPSSKTYILVGIPSDVAYATAQASLLVNMVVLGMVTIFAIAGAWLISEYFILGRINALKKAAKQIMAGDLSARIGIKHNTDELDDLALSFDRMTEVLQERDKKIKQSAEEIKHQLGNMEALRNIDMAITGSLDLRVILTILLDEVTKTLKVDAACVLLLNPHLQTLEFSMGRGFRTDALRETNLHLGESYAGQAALDRKNVILTDLRKSENGFERSPLFPEEGFASYIAAPLISKGNVKGVLELFTRNHFEPNPEWLDFLESLSIQASIAIDNTALFNDLQLTNLTLMRAYDTTLEGLTRALDLRDKETEGHSQRVTEMTIRLARALGVSESRLRDIRRGALLHDVGKMGVPDSILHKPGPLTEEEWEIMHQHPTQAFKLLSSIEFLQPALDIPYCHHEKWDGSGYPRGLLKEQIPIAARIFAVVDVWDALRSDRPYRKAWSKKKSFAYIQEQSGFYFDPRVVDAFVELYNKGDLG